MTGQATGIAVRHTMTVPLGPQSAFDLFTAGIGTWWPAQTDHHLSDVPATAMMEGHEGGRLYERDEQGREIEVTFEQAGDGHTCVSFEHRGFEVHGQAGLELRDSLGAEDGWFEVLGRYQRAGATVA